MSSSKSLMSRMKAAGLRMTQQRRLLVDLLESANEHLDAETVYRMARERDSRIHRATVYRTLKMLKQLGLVDELDLMHVPGDRHFYEVRPTAFHIHLVCVKCGSVEEPGGPFWEDLNRRVRLETGFEPSVVRLEMGGCCTRCQGKAHGETA